MPVSRRSLLTAAGAGAGALLLGACGEGDDSGAEPAGGPVTVEWWHIQNTPPMLPAWDALAKEYQNAHGNVTIQITPIENESFKNKLTTVTQANNPPDIFHTWGGGVLRQQRDAGLIKDLTADVAPWIGTLTPASVQPYQFDGKTYGIPFDVGMVGFWYNKKLFTRAGIGAPPATWAELLDGVRKLKAAGITPISLAGQAKWPGHYYWSYLAIRIAGVAGLQQAAAGKAFDGPEFVEAGRHLKELVDLDPFQRGFLSRLYDGPDGQAAVMGRGDAAMELMGQWAPGVQEEQSGKDLGADLGFFPFPAVPGGKGAITDAFGGGGGFAIGRDAPAAALDFVKFLLSVESQRKVAATGSLIPVTKGAEDAVTDPHAKVVAATLASATGFQLYLDQAFPPAVGQQVNDSVAELIAKKKTPEQVAQDITRVAKTT